MKYTFASHTDVGIRKSTNQDSFCIREAETDKGTVFFALLCDGMGGLAKGELASATLLNAMVTWFKQEFPVLLAGGIEDSVIRARWTEIVRSNNETIMAYGAKNGFHLGTTLSAILLTQERYYVINVGDSRVYEIAGAVRQITEDQTVVAQELKYGIITPEQAENDPRNSVLLQCVGASQVVNPDFFFGTPVRNATYLLCSDGFRHKITPGEMAQCFAPQANTNAAQMRANIRALIELNKQRMEKDNITAALIRTL